MTVAKKGKAGISDAVAQEPVVTAVMVALDKPEPIKRRPKAKRPPMTNARLRKLAEKHKPPESWYDKDEEGLY